MLLVFVGGSYEAPFSELFAGSGTGFAADAFPHHGDDQPSSQSACLSLTTTDLTSRGSLVDRNVPWLTLRLS